LRTGVKNRSLLRQLLSIEPEKHLELIAGVIGKEEVLGSSTQALLKGKSPSAESPPPPPFEFKSDPKGISVPSFKWKKTEDARVLKNYYDSLKTLLTEIENILTNPQV
jgi:hypothetical protein